MATGILGQFAPSAATNTTVYTCPATTFAVASISICNRNATGITARLGLSATATPGTAEWLEFGVTIPANSVLERTGLVVDAGKNLVVWASGTGASAVAYGIETSTV